MEIDEAAPAVAREEIEVAAPPEAVWDLVADVADWPRWNGDVRSVSIVGTASPRTRFRWKAGSATIRSVFRLVERPTAIGWEGRTLGIRARHVYRFEPTATGTRVRSEESWDGLGVRLMRGRAQRMLEEALATGLAHLKAEAERAAG